MMTPKLLTKSQEDWREDHPHVIKQKTTINKSFKPNSIFLLSENHWLALALTHCKHKDAAFLSIFHVVSVLSLSNYKASASWNESKDWNNFRYNPMFLSQPPSTKFQLKGHNLCLKFKNLLMTCCPCKESHSGSKPSNKFLYDTNKGKLSKKC